MKIPVLTEREFEAIRNWDQFIEKIKETPFLFTNEQWNKILAMDITSRTTHLERVIQLKEIRTYIGITDMGLIAIYAGQKKAYINGATGIIWVTKFMLGNYENADVPEIEGVTVSRIGTTKFLGKTEMNTLRKFFSLTTDDLRNVPVLEYEHTELVTEAYYLYSCGTTTVTPLPEGVENIRDFRFVTTNGHTNTIEAIDEMNRSHLGVLRLRTDKKPSIEVIYEAVTNPGTPTTRGADRTVL